MTHWLVNYITDVYIDPDSEFNPRLVFILFECSIIVARALISLIELLFIKK